MVSLDENEATFTPKPADNLSDPKILENYAGKYEFGGTILEVVLKNENQLFLLIPGQPNIQLIPYKNRFFKIKEFADLTIEFITINGKVTAIKQKDPSGEYEMKKK